MKCQNVHLFMMTSKAALFGDTASLAQVMAVQQVWTKVFIVENLQKRDERPEGCPLARG